MIYWIFITGLNVCPGFINTHQWCYESRECKIKISPGLNDKEHTRYCRKHFIFDSPCEKFPVPRPQCVRLGGNNSLGPWTSSFGLEHFMTHSSAIQLLSPLPLYTLTGIQDGRWSEERGKQLGWGGKLGMRRFLITAFTARPQVWGISHAFCHTVSWLECFCGRSYTLDRLAAHPGPEITNHKLTTQGMQSCIEDKTDNTWGLQWSNTSDYKYYERII